MQELKRYLDFCREERHYCALLAHALLSSDAARQRIVARINAVIAGAELQADALEVYVEPAVLRDHWQSLGDFRRYTPALHAARRNVLCKLLAVALAPEPPGRAAVEDFLAQPWLCPPRSKKYVSPGRWPLAAAKAYRGVAGLEHFKWAYNAKPDLMLISSGGCVVIEAKVESGYGRSAATGYDQESVQQVLVRLLPAIVIPTFSECHIRRITLGLRPRRPAVHGTGLADPVPRLLWRDLVRDCEQAGLDEFTIASLRRWSLPDSSVVIEPR